MHQRLLLSLICSSILAMLIATPSAYAAKARKAPPPVNMIATGMIDESGPAIHHVDNRIDDPFSWEDMNNIQMKADRERHQGKKNGHQSRNDHKENQEHQEHHPVAVVVSPAPDPVITPIPDPIPAPAPDPQPQPEPSPLPVMNF